MVEAMEIQKGYKQTAVGVIPSDWDAKPLGAVLKVRHGKSQKEVADTNGEYPILASGGVIGKANKYLYNKPSVLIGRKGTIDKPQFMTKPFWSVDTLFYTEVFENYSPEFLYYNFLLIDWYAYNEASGVPSLNAKTIEQIPIPLPPTKAEQTAIATALNDADALITQLEKLIAKKRAIKQGAMQELLKPKDEWEVKKLGDVFNFKQGVQCPVEKQFYTYQEGLRRFIRIIDLTQQDEIPRFILDPGSSHHVLKDDLFMVRYGTPGLLGYGFEGVIANNLFRLIPMKKINSYFFYFLLFFKNTDIIRISSSTTMAALNFTALRELELSYPTDLKTQTHIAQILSDMDAEIEALENKLNKYKMIKQGMMQNLLTGRIRLV